ncbi:MAG: response regulator [Oscillatoriophycideae cyanobacterium NC_groundwater_1537_Pr4_S-0.65um_50_18]|nr:response regulator [Oscillatoriophycideae cyanobacterium NC_groundwater_1537_Pr4_S-0.65um_50_18]
MANQKVLIIDDSKTVRMQVKDMLPKGNFEVLEAVDGVEGLEIVSQENLSLILVDFFMPRMNGWEVVQKLQDNPRLKSIPVVLMSGRREDVEKAVPDQFGYFEFVGKPFEQPALVQAIKSAMAKARSRQQALQKSAAAAGASSTALSNDAAATKNLQPIAVSAPAPSVNPEILALQTEVKALRSENMQLRTDVEGLKKQVAQIMAFIRQKMK